MKGRDQELMDRIAEIVGPDKEEWLLDGHSVGIFVRHLTQKELLKFSGLSDTNEINNLVMELVPTLFVYDNDDPIPEVVINKLSAEKHLDLVQFAVNACTSGMIENTKKK